MKEKIKVKFVDFWADLNHPETIFFEILSKHYQVEFSEDPEIVFYSNYGKQYQKYKCVRVFVSGENERPDYTACDYAITFDYSTNARHLRFPLWAVYYGTYLRMGIIDKLDTPTTEESLLEIWKSKTKFCCFIVSNEKCKKRNDFFEKLNKRKRVDSAGRYKNNIDYNLEEGTLGKLKFIKDYKFVISFENASHPGYTTEKILEPLLARCIPIYWGDPVINNDFNEGRFINYSNFKSEEHLIEHLLKLDTDNALALEVLSQKVFTEKQQTIEEHENNLHQFLLNLAATRREITPISQNVIYSAFHKTRYSLARFIERISVLQGRVIRKVVSISTIKTSIISK